MSGTVASLWPAQIRAGVQTPWMILQGQDEALTEQTNGVLRGEILRREDENGKAVLSLDIVVPALNDYRHRILVLTYDQAHPYPALVDAEVFRPAGLAAFRELPATEPVLAVWQGKKPANRADSDEEL